MNLARSCWALAAAAVSLAAPIAVAQNSPTHVPPADDPVYDQLVEEFIQWDIGNVRDPFAAERIQRRFAALKADESVPALVRGLNRSTRMRASCPITAIAGKLRSIIAASKNPEVGTYVLQNLDRQHGGQYRHYVTAVYSSAEAQMTRTMGNQLADREFTRRAQESEQRMAFSPGMKLTDLPAREPSHDAEQPNDTATRTVPIAKHRKNDAARTGTRAARPSPDTIAWTRLEFDQLIERLGDPTVRTKALSELYRRGIAGQAGALADHGDPLRNCLKDADDAGRELAARLLGHIRCEDAVPDLIDAIEDSSAKVRSAAATALARITRQLFGPNDNASEAERRQAVARWRAWSAEQSKNQ